MSRLAVAGLSALILYFAFHAFAGDQGLGAWSDKQREVDALERKLAELEAERDRLRVETAMLDPRNPDPDYVETLARETLGYVKVNEFAVAVK